MKLTEQKYRAERGDTANTYQSLTVTAEMEGDRRFLTVELDFLGRWRSPSEWAYYFRWAADQVEKLT